MKFKAPFWGLLLLLSWCSFALADSCGPDVLQQARSPGLWALVRSPNLTESWVPVRAKESFAAYSVIRFAFVGRSIPSVPDREGVVAVKFFRPLGQYDQSVSRITLRRTINGPSCGIYSHTITQWLSLPLDFNNGQTVNVGDYIIYHATDRPNNSKLLRFHVEYRSQTDGCISTDSSSGNRRTAFLANYDGPPIQATDEVIAAIRQQLSSSASASETQQPSLLRLPRIIAGEAKAFQQFAAVETQIHSYQLDGRLCVAFDGKNPFDEKDGTLGTTSLIEIVDLDEPRTSGESRRKRWTIDWK
jgi:hypothetical protein